MFCLRWAERIGTFFSSRDFASFCQPCFKIFFVVLEEFKASRESNSIWNFILNVNEAERGEVRISEKISRNNRD
jgi:hypothetical protein